MPHSVFIAVLVACLAAAAWLAARRRPANWNDWLWTLLPLALLGLLLWRVLAVK